MGVDSTGSQRSMSGVILYLFFSYPLETMSLNCKFAIFPKLAGQVALRNHLSLSLSVRSIGTCSFLCGFWGSNLNSHAHTEALFLTEPFLYLHRYTFLKLRISVGYINHDY